MDERRVIVYAGRGSSHSWTWLADLFERRGVLDARFLDTSEFTEGLTGDSGVAIISGGDGFSIASGIGPHGFSHLKGFIHRGGTYVGICAGAYLPLPSSIDPFDKFNLSETRIENIDRCLASEAAPSPRFSVRYGTCAVIHPVRGELELEAGSSTLRAPLYGGPIFKEPSSDDVLVRYRSLTDDTEIQIQRERAESILVGKPAVIRARHGHGELFLLGPHLEHPRYQEANDLFMMLLGLRGGPQRFVAEPEVRSRSLVRAVADLKVAVLGLENRTFLVGNKLWDGSRFLELVSAIEARMSTVEGEFADAVSDDLMRVRAEILRAEPQSLLYADEGPELLVRATRMVVDHHFAVLRERGSR